MDILNEATKEVLFGGVAGLAAGYISKKAGNQLVGILLGKKNFNFSTKPGYFASLSLFSNPGIKLGDILLSRVFGSIFH
jgi:hypothetical protein